MEKASKSAKGSEGKSIALRDVEIIPIGGDPAGAGVEKIRELLFGNQMSDYDRRLATLEDRFQQIIRDGFQAKEFTLRSREEPELQTIVTLATAGAVPKTLARIVESLAQTYLALDRAQRETVDAMDDNAEAALYLLARVDTKHSDSSVSDAIAAFDARTALERLAGGLIRPTELADRTGWSRQSILDWSNANRLLAVEDNGRRKYPQCQFGDKGNILPGLDHVLGALASNGVRGWMALDFLFSIDPVTGETPIALLRSGRIDEAVHSAKIFGEEGAA